LLTAKALCQGAEEDFTLYTKQKGLSDNQVTGITQDSTGYLWISTGMGLDRFDGSHFVNHSSVDSLSIPASAVKGLTWLDNQRLVAFGRGMHIMDTYSHHCRNLFIPFANSQYQFKFNGIKAVTSNKEGDLFVLTNSGFYHYNRDYRLTFRFDYYPIQQVDTAYFNFGRKFLWIDQQRLIIVSAAGLYCYNTAQRKFKKMEANDFKPLKAFIRYPDQNVDFYQPLKESLIVLDHEHGSIVYINLKENRITTTQISNASFKKEFDYRSELIYASDTSFYLTGNLSGFYTMNFDRNSGKFFFNPKKHLPSYYCKQLLIGKNKILWIATNRGLLKYNNFHSLPLQSEVAWSVQDQFPNLAMLDICISHNKIYAGTKGNGGLLEFDKELLTFKRRISLENIFRQPSSIYSIIQENQENILVATNGPLCRLNTKTGKLTEVALQNFDRLHSWVTDLYRDNNQNIWIAAGKIYCYNTKQKKISLIPQSGIPLEKIVWVNRIQQDSEGNLWFSGHGLIRYNIHTQTFDRLVNNFPYINMPDKQVNSFVADGNGNLWINSNDNGLICYNVHNGSFRQFTSKTGLPDNNIAAMAIIKNKLWMATPEAMACLDLLSFKIISFSEENGFPDQPIALNAKFYYDEKANKLYIGYSDRIIAFDPDQILAKRQSPQMFVESVVTPGHKRLALPGNQIVTPWQSGELSVRIGTIDFFTANSQRFAYRIADHADAQWQQLGTQSTFAISNLSPGHHLVQIKLVCSTNQWPEQIREIEIMLTPPFWKTWWFDLIMAFIGAIVLYGIFLWRMRIIRKKEQAKTHLQKLVADEYKNQFELEQISHYFSSSLIHKKNVEDVLWDVSKNLIGKMNYEDCMIYLWNKEKTKMIQKASWGPKGDPKAISESVFDVAPGQGIVGHVILTREPIIIPDTRKDSRYRVDDVARLSEICVPIIHDGELIGVIDSEHSEVNHFQKRDIKILTTIATLISNKIKQIESEQSLATKQREITNINYRLAEAQLQALQTQMNPHFIFNSLNSINRMILEDESQKASRYMSKFANLLRITLNQSKQAFTTLYENMEHLENYLSMEKLRFDDSFTFRITADKEIDTEEVLIPTMMIQPLAENAVWHGLIPKKGRKKLLIHFSKMDDDTISCNIEDNGIGIHQSEELKKLNRPLHHSVGINNLRNRIKILNEKFDAGCHLKIIDLNDIDRRKTGSRVVLSFRIINKLKYESNLS
jgi:ligand-binding sensor domain-containing protein/putative methionine-R-sulfoxide reductase with GAF domain